MKPDPAGCETQPLRFATSATFCGYPNFRFACREGRKVTPGHYFSNALATTMAWALSCMVFDPTAGLAARSRPA